MIKIIKAIDQFFYNLTPLNIYYLVVAVSLITIDVGELLIKEYPSTKIVTVTVNYTVNDFNHLDKIVAVMSNKGYNVTKASNYKDGFTITYEKH